MEVDPTLGEMHLQLVTGDASVANEIATLALSSLRPQLRHAFPRVGTEILIEACEDAILDYLRCPQRFDVARGVPLAAYLYRASWRNVADKLDAVARRRAREQEFAT